MEQHIEKIAGLLRDTLVPEAAVAAVFHSGSQVVGAATADSDIDFTILIREPDDALFVRKRIASVFEYRGLCHDVDQYDFEGARLACTMWPKRQADDMVAAVFHSINGLLAFQGALQHKLVEAVAVHDPADLLRDYQRQLSQYPDALAKAVMARATKYLQEEYLDDWTFRSRFHFAFTLRDMLEHIAVALYASNKRFFMPPLKRWPADLRQLRPSLESELFVLIDTDGGSALQPQQAALSAIVERLRPAAQR
jgi:pimeloyl-ACP methyl ester carboxylesterase